MIFQSNDIVLFQGDSITDASRYRDDVQPNSPPALGTGYAQMAAAELLDRHAGLDLRIYNRGVGGDVVGQLDQRWQTDCLDLKPNVLSILVGVNDTARQLHDSPDGATVEVYDSTYRRIVDLARQPNPQLRLVICEPFVLMCGEITEKWLPGLKQRQAMAKKIAEDYQAVWVPFQSMFDAALADATDTYWLDDGVHPSPGAHHRMAKLWLDKTC